MTHNKIFKALALFFALLCLAHPPSAQAEGSRSLYPSGISGNRANTEWRTNVYGGLLYRRTLLHVYAVANEYILVASSAVGVASGSTSGDILIFNPGRVSGTVGNETIPTTPDFQASSQSGKGKIISRAQELAGPKSADGTAEASTNCYAAAFYMAPITGIYSIVMYGPDGENSSADVGPAGDVALSSTSDFDANQATSIAAWDVTVRSGISSITDEDGRLFANYLALYTGGNGRPLYSTVYACTTDGYQYQIDLNGLDPNGFILYGDQAGFADSDGSPLYHDLRGIEGSAPNGGARLTPPDYPVFFNPPDSNALAADACATAYIAPSLTNVSFIGTGGTGGSNSRLGMGGTFSFTSNLSAVYDIVISRDGVSFDPTATGNRRLRGVRPAGTNTIPWDGKDNGGVNFPVGTNYQFHAVIHAGEYHFPMLDAENSTLGGPKLTLLNASSNPLGTTTGFYDDRGYRASNGTYVTSDGTAATLNQALPGVNPASPAFSDPLNGFDTHSAQRAFGSASGGNTGAESTGSFGDTKGLDLWTYYPSATQSNTLNIQGTPVILLVKRITAVNGTDTTGFDDDPGTPDDNSPYWPSPASTYLRGSRSVASVKPGDELEYTIYFLDTQGPGTNITLADVLPANTTFETTAYTPASGIALALDSSTLPSAPTSFLTNAADSDAGQFYAPGTAGPAAANPPTFASSLPAASNVSGVVAVTLAPSPATLPAATGPGTPSGSYGFLRFRVRVN